MAFDIHRELASSIRQNWKNRYWIKNRFIHDLLLPILFPRNEGTYVLKERWDNLIILDACRYDIFKSQFQMNDIAGELETRTSRGTETKEFLWENFGGEARLGDLVYVTASPWVTKYYSGRFHAIVPVWRDGWNDENGTVLPQDMFNHALRADETYPDKRLIIHFVQPHRPFIDYARIDWWKDGVPPFRFRPVWGSVAEHGRSLLEVMDKDTMLKFYRRNLRIVQPFVQKLLENLRGTTVVSSDHGEAFGEWLHPLIPIRVYGHPGHTRIASLTQVPWLKVQSSEPKQVRAESEGSKIESLSKQDEDLINQRLSALGYA